MVFLVALPLSLGIAIASGAPVMAGLIAGVVGGIVAGMIGGSPLQVSGPAAGLTVVVAELVANFGWKVTCAITVAAGVLQIVFGLSRVAQSALAIAPVVVHAMLAGIGITIALQQIHVLLGGSSRSDAWENLTALPGQIVDFRTADVLVGGLVVVIMLTWPLLPENVRKVPAPLVAIVAATLVAIAAPIDAERIELGGNFFDSIALPELPTGNWSAVVLGVITVALIASVESLLSAVAVDKMHTGPRTEFNRELLGQGSANITSGMLGGLPVTGVIVRSSTNVATGARTRASTVMHGVWLLVFSVLLTGLVQQIPTAALAGLLVVIGIQLVKLAHMRLALRTGDLWVYLITMLSVIFLNLLEGVGIGLAVAVLVLIWRVVRAEMSAEQFGTDESRQWRVSVRGSLSFLALPRLTKTLSSVPADAHVSLELDTDYLDHAAADMIEDWKRAHEANGGTVLIQQTGGAMIEDAPMAPPARRAAFGRGLGLVPWKFWQSGTATDSPRALQPIRDGVDEYHRNGADELLGYLTDLTDGQDPDTLFVTCADSRVVPNVITSSGPGDLFTVRNVGNLVPAAPATDTSVEAAIEFAIDELGVSSAVVCGHSSCGAMKALIAGDASDGSGPVASWLQNAQPSLAAFRSGHPAGLSAAVAGFDEVDQLGIVNVAVQLQTLQRHPVVGRAVADGRMRVAGLFFDINTARVVRVTTSGVEVGEPDGVPRRAIT